MFKGKRGIYVIALSLLGLLCMQGMWVYYAMRQEKKFLDEGSRQAAIETISLLEQKEDSRLLIMNLDTLIKGRVKKLHEGMRELKVVVNDGQTRIIMKDTVPGGMATAYAFSTNSDGKNRTITSSEFVVKTSPGQKFKAKVSDYDHLLKKIVHQSHERSTDIKERLDFKELVSLLSEKLQARGIDIVPELAVKNRKGKIVYATNGFTGASGIVLPMFTRDIQFQDDRLHLFFPSTTGFLFRRSFGVVMMSLGFTLLLIIVMLMLYSRMLTEKKLNQYKNDFINNLTHELKTPLATISLANSNIASVAALSGQRELHQYTGIIEEESRKLNDHIEKVFELSLLEKEQQILDNKPEDVHALVQQAIQLNKGLLDSRNVRLELKLSAANHTAVVDRFHFINALGNLIDNAVKYSKGIPELSISSNSNGEHWMLTVKDNGIGISREHQKFIFDKFFRVTINNLHDTKGFGIGLSYVKQTIELFGGMIEVKSEENHGSEFIIRLPYVKD